MEAEVITKLENLILNANATLLEIDGVKFSPTHLHDPRKKEPEPDPMVTNTLGGLVKYLQTNHDELHVSKVVHVVTPNLVQLVGPLHGFFQQRFVFAEARTPNVAASSKIFSFGAYLPVEEMIISLQSLFTPDGSRAEVLRLLGVVKDEVVTAQEDDGVSQRVSAKAGISFVEEVKVPNPVTLHPYRTFREVNQPPSQFILRARKSNAGITFALFEAEGEAWELEAVRNVAEWLDAAELGETPLIF